MRSKLSVLGIYNYDSQIFDRLELPEGVDKETVVNSILLECADLEVLYPVPVVLQTAIGLWSKSMLPSWNRQYKAIMAEYDPIENYNRLKIGKIRHTPRELAAVKWLVLTAGK